jgi:hypothetical protein
MTPTYFVVLTNHNKETGKTGTKTINEFSTFDLALTNFYSAMKDNTSNSKIDYCNCMVINEHGVVLKNDFYEEHVEPEPEPEEE